MIYALRAVSFLRSQKNPKYIASLVQKRFIKLQPVSVAINEASETFEERNTRLKRPLSPHLSIYKIQLTSVLSITHRATGILLVGYCFAFGIACRFYTVPEIINLVNSLGLSHAQLLAGKALFIYPFCYHLFNGLRHLVWDAGIGLNIKSVYKTGYAVLALSILGSIGFVLYFQ